MADLNLHHLRLFRAVAREGHLTRAAEGLNLSQSALSSQIRTLEARLGHALFERRGRGLHLTEAGRIALAHAEAIHEAAAQLLDTLGGQGEVQGGGQGVGRVRVLRVGAQATLSRNLQLAVLRPLLGRADVALRLRAGSGEELIGLLSTHALDVVLTSAPPEAGALAGLRVQAIDTQPVGLFGLPDRLRAPDLASLLTREGVIVPASGLRAGFDALCDRHGVRPSVAAEVDDMALMRLLARAGAGLALAPRVVLADELAEGSLVAAPFDLGLTETFHAVTQARRFPNPLLAELLATLPLPPDPSLGGRA